MAEADTLAPPETKPPEVKAPPKDAPRGAPPVDNNRVSQALGLGPMQRQLDEDRAKVESLTPGPPRLTPPPQVPPPTDPFQAFGQPAMWLATFGSLLTRHHLTSAIQSAGAVLDSVHKQDDEAVKRAMAEWKINSENAQKMATYELNAYRAALSHQSNDIREAQAKITTLNHAFQNAVYTEAFNRGGLPEVEKLVTKAGKDTATLAGRQLKLDQELETQASRLASMKKWQTDNPEAAKNPVLANAAKHTIAAGGIPNEQGLPIAKPGAEKAETTQWQERVDPATNQTYRSRTGPDGKPQYQDMAGNPIAPPSGAQRIGTLSKGPSAGSPAEIQKNVEEDLKVLHPEWSPGRRAIEAKSQIAAGTAQAVADARLKAQQNHPPLTPEGADMEAKIMLITGAVPGGGRMGQAGLTQVMNAAAKLVEGSGHTIEDYLAKRAEYKADTASLRALAVRTDALDAAAKATKREFSDVVIPNIPKSPEPLDMQLLTRWVRSGETQFGDTDVPVFMAALISGLDEYAKVLAGATGAAGSTDASRAQAISVIKDGSTTAQIKDIIERVIYPTIDIKIGTYNQQKDQISGRISGRPPRTEPAAPGAPSSGATPAAPARPSWVPPGAQQDKSGRWLVQQDGSWHVVTPKGQ